MKVWDWFLGFFNKDDGTLPLDVCVGTLAAEVFYKELAIQSCINLISNTVARGEWLTYEKGKEVRKDNYYLFNVEPNQNKSSSKFWREVIYNLVYDNECLVIQNDGMFYVANSFTVDRYAFYENIYKEIVIENYKLNRSYVESEVFHFELHNDRIKTLIDGLYESYGKLISASSSKYIKRKGSKGTLKIPTDFPQTEAAQADLKDLLDRRFKTFFSSEGDAVLPLTNGMEYEETNKDAGKGSGVEGREIRAFIDDIFDLVAIAFQVPPQLLKGNVADTDKAMNNFLTFCVNPIAEILTDEINRKYYGKKAYLERTYVKLDTTRIKAVDIKDIASSLDILTRIGAHSIDDNLRILGMEPLNTEWSKVKWMTKNYERADKLAKGGD